MTRATIGYAITRPRFQSTAQGIAAGHACKVTPPVAHRKHCIDNLGKGEAA
jgi:hypothetical protein